MSERLKAAIREREPVLGTWLSIGHPAVAEIAAMSGVDVALIDTEHTTIDHGDVQGMIRAMEAVDGPTEPVVRVPENDPVPIKRTLDTGAAGIMVPLVETAEGAREAVAATRYPPEGVRGVAGSRAAGYGQQVEEYVRTAGERLLTIVQVETERAVGNAGAMAAVEGVDALFVGPSDLSASLDVFGDLESDAFVDAVGTVLDAAHAHDVPVGTFAPGEETIRRGVALGFDFMIAGKDAAHLAAGIDESRATYEDAMEDVTTR